MKTIMQKTKQIFTLITLIAILATPMNTYADTLSQRNVVLQIDGKEVQFNDSFGFPTVKNGRTLVPLRIVSEDMGYEVDWSKDTWHKGDRRVWVKNDTTTIELEIGSNKAIVNGKSVYIDTKEDANGKIVPVDTKAQLINGRTYVPLRFISENMDCTVDWKIEGKTLFVYINKPTGETQLPEVGTLPGTAETGVGSEKENLEKIENFFGDDVDNSMTQIGNDGGMTTFNPIGGGTDTNFITVDSKANQSFDVEIVIKDWYIPAHHDGIDTEEAYKKINPTVKELLRYYLPNGHEKLYQIIDDGYNWRWDDASKYLNKDIQNLIGSDGRTVKLFDGEGGFVITIGEKR